MTRRLHARSLGVVKGGVMLTYEQLRAFRARPDRRPREARRIALAARAVQRVERRRVQRGR
jgi:hypothetical protein